MAFEVTEKSTGITL